MPRGVKYRGWSPEFSTFKWFNVSGPKWLVPAYRQAGRTLFRPWNLHHRRNGDYHQWGIGVLQYGSRHLAYVGRYHCYGEAPYWTYSFGFRQETRTSRNAR